MRDKTGMPITFNITHKILFDVSELLKTGVTPSPVLEAPSDCPVISISPEQYLNNINFSHCNASHIGPKILASHVSVHLPTDVCSTVVKNENKKHYRALVWKVLIGLCLASTIVFLGFLSEAFFIPQIDESEDEFFIDEGDLPLDW